jgi:hypothetical protein
MSSNAFSPDTGVDVVLGSGEAVAVADCIGVGVDALCVVAGRQALESVVRDMVTQSTRRVIWSWKGMFIQYSEKAVSYNLPKHE